MRARSSTPACFLSDTSAARSSSFIRALLARLVSKNTGNADSRYSGVSSGTTHEVKRGRTSRLLCDASAWWWPLTKRPSLAGEYEKADPNRGRSTSSVAIQFSQGPGILGPEGAPTVKVHLPLSGRRGLQLTKSASLAREAEKSSPNQRQ